MQRNKIESVRMDRLCVDSNLIENKLNLFFYFDFDISMDEIDALVFATKHRNSHTYQLLFRMKNNDFVQQILCTHWEIGGKKWMPGRHYLRRHSHRTRKISFVPTDGGLECQLLNAIQKEYMTHQLHNRISICSLRKNKIVTTIKNSFYQIERNVDCSIDVGMPFLRRIIHSKNSYTYLHVRVRHCK